MPAEMNAKPDLSLAGSHEKWATALVAAIWRALPDAFHGQPYVAPAGLGEKEAANHIAPPGCLLVKLWNRATGYKHRAIIPLGEKVEAQQIVDAAIAATTPQHGQHWKAVRDTKWSAGEYRAAEADART